jgi:predicted DNA-binding transcriptional regulator AlpA
MGVSISLGVLISFRRLEREGKFPARVTLTASNLSLRLTDVQEWIRKK